MSGASHRQARPMEFRELDTGCFVCVSHRTNHDGYLYKTWAVDGKKVREAFHRFIYRSHHGLDAIPDSDEVDHKCRIRACCNPKHLRLIERSDHKAVTNAERYAGRNEEALTHWLSRVTAGVACTGTELAGLFGVTFSTGCRWIRDWRQDEDIIPLLRKSANMPSEPF